MIIRKFDRKFKGRNGKVTNKSYMYIYDRVNGDLKCVKSLGVLGKDITRMGAKKLLQDMLRMRKGVDHKKLEMTISELWARYLHIHKDDFSEDKFLRYQFCGRRVLKEIGHVKLKDIKYEVFLSLKKSLVRSEYGTQTIRIYFNCVKNVVKYAKSNYGLEWDMLFPNIKKDDAVIPKTLTDQQINILLRNAPKDIKFSIIFLLYTGIRPDEFVDLTWADVDLEKGVVTVTSNRENKSYGERKIGLTDEIINILKERKSEKITYDFEKLVNIKKRNLYNSCFRLGKKVDIDFSLRVIRRCFSTKLANMGVDSVRIARMLGHSTVGTQHKHYIGSVTSDWENSKEVLEKGFEGICYNSEKSK